MVEVLGGKVEVVKKSRGGGKNVWKEPETTKMLEAVRQKLNKDKVAYVPIEDALKLYIGKGDEKYNIDRLYKKLKTELENVSISKVQIRHPETEEIVEAFEILPAE